MDPDRAARQLVAVVHRVVGAGSQPRAYSCHAASPVGRPAARGVEHRLHVSACGAVNGWCAARAYPSASHSKSGNSVTHSPGVAPPRRPSRSPRWRRSASSAISAPPSARARSSGPGTAPGSGRRRRRTGRRPASRSPRLNARPSGSSSAFANWPARPSAVRFTQSAPEAPAARAIPASSSSSLRDSAAPPGTTIPRMRAPDSPCPGRSGNRPAAARRSRR
jgi:hypothetical protein